MGRQLFTSCPKPRVFRNPQLGRTTWKGSKKLLQDGVETAELWGLPGGVHRRVRTYRAGQQVREAWYRTTPVRKRTQLSRAQRDAMAEAEAVESGCG